MAARVRRPDTRGQRPKVEISRCAGAIEGFIGAGGRAQVPVVFFGCRMQQLLAAGARCSAVGLAWIPSCRLHRANLMRPTM